MENILLLIGIYLLGYILAGAYVYKKTIDSNDGKPITAEDIGIMIWFSVLSWVGWLFLFGIDLAVFVKEKIKWPRRNRKIKFLGDLQKLMEKYNVCISAKDEEVRVAFEGGTYVCNVTNYLTADRVQIAKMQIQFKDEKIED